MSYGELNLGPSYQPDTKFQKDNRPHNKGKKWSEWMSKRGQRNSRKGWQNIIKHRPRKRSEKAGRKKMPIIAVLNDGSWLLFSYSVMAARWCGGRRENVCRCCRDNQERRVNKKGEVNTDHSYRGARFYYECDRIWLDKIKG